jgi:hypothetical protein
VRRTVLRRVACAVALVATALLVVSGPAAAAPAWRQHVEDDALAVRYKIEAELRSLPDEESPRLIKGRETIVWTNLSDDRVDTLQFHLYANAFRRDEKSAFLRERKRDGRPLPDPMVWGGTEIQQILLVDSPGRQPTTEFVPADGAPDDRTVLRVKLPQPVEPRGRAVLQVAFTTELPKPVARMGAVKDFVFAAQWYPKLGRYLGRGTQGVPHVVDGWFCPPYHAAGEFSADFADYDVSLTVPATWTVGASGVPAGEETRDAAAGTRTGRWQARSVVDFAWTAGLRTLERVRTIDPDDPSRTDVVANEVRLVRSLLGLTDEDADLPPVEVVLLLQPEHADQEERHFEAARVALALYGTWLGPYPYPRLTIVDPAYGAGAVGGMEYPTLVTAGTSIDSPVGARRPEHVVVHEIGHQWFMNLLASNETLEAWLDEGLNTWFTARAMHLAWGPPSQLTTVLGLHFPTEPSLRFPGLTAGWPELWGFPAWAKPPDLEGFRLWRDGPTLLLSETLRYRPDQSPVLPSRRSWLRTAGWDELVQPSWEYVSGDSYSGNSYPRAVLLLESIARQVRDRYDSADDRDGERRVIRAFREYARQYRFRHPTTRDLLRVLQQVTEMPELPQLFDTLARTSGVLDYAVESVSVPDDDAAAPVRSEVLVRRRGEIVVPVTLHLEFHDGRPAATQVWDGASRWTRITVDGRVKSVRLDPARWFPQDANLSNNDWTDRRNARPAAKWGAHALLWLQNALTAWGRFF